MYSGYLIATEALDLEIYLLATLFNASSSMQDYEKENKLLPFIRRTFEESEVSRRLINLAVILRSYIDNNDVKSDAIVGQLIQNTSKQASLKVLTLRESCNKIIHANFVDLYEGSTYEEAYFLQ